MTEQSPEAIALKEQLELRAEARRKKIAILNGMDTKAIVEEIIALESDLESALREEASFKDIHVGFLSSGTNDCTAVKRILAELGTKGPGGDKKLTAPERDAWLTLQRTQNSELKDAIQVQQNTAFQYENIKIATEMVKQKLDSRRKILSLRTAQVEFLSEK